jgi:hypothetical protein
VLPHEPAPCEPTRRARWRLALRDVNGLASVVPEDVQLFVMTGLRAGSPGFCSWVGDMAHGSAVGRAV